VSGRRAFVWLAEEYLTVQFATEPLAQYRVVYERDHHQLRDLTEPRLFETRYRSAQPPLLELRADHWRLMFRLPAAAPRRRRRPAALVQLPLLPDEPPAGRQPG
jgi:hypothetical protein